MPIPKNMTTKWASGRKYAGYYFNGKVYKTKLMLNRAWKKYAGTNKQTKEATPLYYK